MSAAIHQHPPVSDPSDAETSSGVFWRYQDLPEGFFTPMPGRAVRHFPLPVTSAHNAIWDFADGGDGRYYFALCNEFSSSESVRFYAFDPQTHTYEMLFDGAAATLCPPRAIPHSKIHTSIHPMGDGRLIMTTHTTSPAPGHPYWMFDSYYAHPWEGFPGSHVLIYDPVTRDVRTLGCPVPHDSIYGAVFDPERRALFFNTFLRGHLYRLDLDTHRLTDFGKVTEWGSYRICRDRVGNIFTSSRSGHLFCVPAGGDTLEHLGSPHEGPDTNALFDHHRAMNQVDTGPDGKLWASWGFSDRLYTIDPSTLKFDCVGNYLPEALRSVQPNLNCLLKFDHKGILWLASMMPYGANASGTVQWIRWDVMNGHPPQWLGMLASSTRAIVNISESVLDSQRNVLYVADTNHSDDPPMIAAIDLDRLEALEGSEELTDPLPLLCLSDANEVFPELTTAPAAEEYRRLSKQYACEMVSYLESQADTKIVAEWSWVIRVWEHLPFDQGHVHAVRWHGPTDLMVWCGPSDAPTACLRLHTSDMQVHSEPFKPAPIGATELPPGFESPPARRGRRFLNTPTATCPVQDGILVGTADGMVSLHRQGRSPTSYGCLNLVGPVHAMVADKSGRTVFGVAGDPQDLGLLFRWDADAGLVELGRTHLSSLEAPGCSSCTQPRSLDLCPAGETLAIGCADRLGCVFLYRGLI